MEKYYKISESKLVELLATSIEMDALNAYGVDNWMGYGENFNEIIQEYFPDKKEEELEDTSFEDCAEILLADYVEVEN